MHRAIRRGLAARGKSRNFCRGLLALAAVVVAYSGVEHAYSLYDPVAKWPASDIPVLYWVNPTNWDGLPEADVIQAVQDGANVWGSVPNASFSFAYAGQTNRAVVELNGYNDVFFRNASNFFSIGTTYTWVDTVTNEILESDQVFWDKRMKFFTHADGGCSRGYFVEGITAHEKGHSAGIAHSEVPQATMYASASYCDASIEVLHEDDMDALRALYPDGTATQPPMAPSDLTATLDATDPTAQVVILAWTDNAEDEDWFVIERSLDGENFQYLGQTAGANLTSYADASVLAETTYWYQVVAENSGGPSGPSNMVSETTVAAPNIPPTANAGGPYSGTVGQSVTFDGGGSSDPDGDPLTYAWDFGDGNSGSGEQVSHTYASVGTYTVMLTVSDGNGGGATDTTSASIQAQPAITLSAAGYKVQGIHHADLTWDGATGATVSVHRDGSVIDVTPNDGTYTDNVNARGGGSSYTYQVCEPDGASVCSNSVTVSF